MEWLKRWLALPETVGLDLDDPALTNLRRDVLRRKAFLRRLYSEWYAFFESVSAVVPSGVQIELGSGAGFLKDVLPNVFTSDVLEIAGVDSVFSAEDMPFADGSVSAFFMIDVLHHVPHPARFLAEAARCLTPGGRAAIVDTYNSPWGRWVYQHLHHEPFDPSAAWELPGSGPLSSSNQAIASIIFERDRARYDREFPNLHVRTFEPLMPVAYLLSGGVAMRSLIPGALYPACRAVERLAGPWSKHLGMFVRIELERVPEEAEGASG